MGVLAVLQALPAPALAALAERLINSLDALAPDPDAELDDDGEAGPGDGGPTWTPTIELVECGQVRLA